MRRNSEAHQLQLKLIAVPTLNEFLALYSQNTERHVISPCGQEKVLRRRIRKQWKRESQYSPFLLRTINEPQHWCTTLSLN